MIGFSELRAQAWKYATFALGVLAVALLIVGLLFRVRATDAVARADAAEQRAEASEARAKALSEALARDRVADSATTVAKKATEGWQADNAARAARVKGYANAAADGCAADADLVRELQEGSARVSSAADRLRGL